MRTFPTLLNWCSLFSGVMILAVLAGAKTPQARSDPVEEIAKILESRQPGQEERNQELAKRLASLHDLGDLRRALELHWPSPEGEKDAATTAYRKLFSSLAERFAREAQQVLKNGALAHRLATLTLLASMTPESRFGGKELPRSLMAEVAALAQQGDSPEIRLAAARTLGRVNPDPHVSTPALASLLSSKELTDRRAAAVGLMETALFLARAAEDEFGFYESHAEPKDVVATGRAVLPLVARGLADADSQVRGHCLKAPCASALALSGYAARPMRVDRASLDPQTERDLLLRLASMNHRSLLPLEQAFQEPLAALIRDLKNSDSSERLAVDQALEAIADARLRMLQLSADDVRIGQAKGPAAVDIDPLRSILRNIAPILAEQLMEKDVRLRLAALYVLESLEAEAAPATGAVVKALGDADLFVRWGALRTLAKLGPADAEKAVPGLIGGLDEASSDLRSTALLGLEHFGRAASGAVPALRRAIHQNDVDTRALVIQALTAIGPAAKIAAPELIETLSDPKPRVCAAGALALGKLRPGGEAAVKALTKALDDSDAEVRLAAADALLKQGPG